MAQSSLSSLGRGAASVSVTLARNLRRLRLRRELTPERMAGLAGVNVGDVDLAEKGKFEPTLAMAWKLANALEVPFSALLAEHAPGGTVVTRKDRAKVIVSQNLGLASRALLPFDEQAGIEFYELKFAPGHIENSPPHAAGTREMLHVSEGVLEIGVGREPPYRLNKGDSIQFAGDLRHRYFNPKPEPAVAYLVMTYQ